MADGKPSTSGLSPYDLNKLPRGAVSMRGTPLLKNARLPSLKGPRDLTLSKRTFTPNIPVRREKQPAKPNVAAASASHQQSHHVSRDSRGRGRAKKTFVQTPGALFGEGVASVPKPSTFRDTSYTSTETVRKPVIKPDAVIKIEKRDSDEERGELSDKFLDGSDDDEVGYEDDPMCPVTVPLRDDSNKKKTGKRESKYSDSIDGTVPSKIKKDDETKECPIKPELFEKLTLDPHSSEDQLFLLEFPDYFVFPEMNKSEEKTKDATEESKSQTPSASTTTETASEGNPWANLTEGCIGKLQFLRSGKCQLVVGNLTFQLFNKEPCPYLQELIAVSTDDGKTDITSLGDVKSGIRFLPTIDDSLTNNRAPS